MVSSKTRKAEKKKDFQKPKLKVGKLKPKPANATDTSFKARSIVLRNQSLHVETPSDNIQISRHIAQLASASESQRRESLNALINGAGHHRLSASVLPRCLPLMIDASLAIRMQLLKLLKSVPSEDLAGMEERLILHLQSGMTSISVSVRDTTLEFLDWSVQTLSISLVRSRGGWLKILRCFCLLFGWPDSLVPENTGHWSNNGHSLERLGKDRKLLLKALHVLGRFMTLGLGLCNHSSEKSVIPNGNLGMHMLPNLIARHPKTFSQIGVFGKAEDDEMRAYIDPNDRAQAFHLKFEKSFVKGLETIKRHGGDLGRSAANIERIIGKNAAGLW